MQFVLVVHSLLRWAIILVGIWTLLNAISGVFTKRKFSNKDDKSNLLFMIFCDIQLIFGLILFFGNSWFSNFKDMAGTMSNPNSRFFTVEHECMMLIAWVLVHVGRSSVKKADTDAKKHKRMLIFFGIAIILIFAAIPWSFRTEIARPLFQWFN